MPVFKTFFGLTAYEMFMEGERLSVDDQRRADLAAYVTTLSQGDSVYPQLE